jgi:hypothetical protein
MKLPNRMIGCALITIFLPLIGRGDLPEKNPYLEAALKAESWISQTAISTSDGLTWPADPQNPESGNSTLYAGTPGVVLFYLELHAVTGGRDYL